jgi:CheY-like chemotaxis protein
MPERDGYETIQTLRNENRKIPIIAISGKEEKYKFSLQVAAILGADLVLRKSADKKDLLAAIQSLLPEGAKSN